MSTNKPLRGSSGPYPARFQKCTPGVVTANAQRYLAIGAEAVVKGLNVLSPQPIPVTAGEQCAAFLSRIVRPDRFYNMVHAPDGGRLSFPGVTLPSEDLLNRESAAALPTMSQGMLIRPNPVMEVGSGYQGCHCDRDVTHFDFAVLESDILPRDLQEALLARLIVDGLPIRSVVFSGGKSLHALVWIGAADEEEYRAKVRGIFDAVVPLGIDSTTGNPSRMSRLPGSYRCLPDGTSKVQTLLFLA